jgi:lincosamide nucleotidyltransferase A/C/D/E
MPEHLQENDLAKEMELKQQMTAEDVVGFYNELEKLGVQIWIDGGWGVDALLEESTRIHGDLDILVQKKDVAAVRSLLESRGYEVVPRDDLSDLNFHLRDNHGHEIDFTVIEFDEEGNGIYGPVENGEMNPADSFKGEGSINGQPVRCVSPQYAVQFRTGYELRDIDRQDVMALCDKFGLELPEEYKETPNETVL